MCRVGSVYTFLFCFEACFFFAFGGWLLSLQVVRDVLSIPFGA